MDGKRKEFYPKKIISIMLMCASTVTYMISPIKTYAEDVDAKNIIYVSVDGNDNNSGSQDKPLATMVGARNKLRQMRKNGENVSGATVIFREGTYSITSSVEFIEEDSGENNAPIKYMAYPGEDVQFIGGVKVKSSDFSNLTDAGMTNKCVNSDVANNIIQYNLRTVGIENIPEPNWPGAYSYSWAAEQIHGLTKGEGAPEVFVDGKVLTVARFPNDTNMTIKKVINGGEYIRAWYDDKIGSSEYIKPEDRKNTPFTIVPSQGDVSRWKNANHALIYGKFYWDWADQTVPLGSVNVEEGSITSKYPSEYGCKEGQTFYIYNLFEEIDIPGEYYIDIDTGILYMYPPEDNKDFDVMISVLGEDVIRATGAKNIIFSGININYTKGSALRFENCENVVFQNAQIGFTASKAAHISECKQSGIDSCYIHDVEGGIDVSGGDIEKLISAGNFVRNCHIERFARLTKTYNPAISLSGVGNEILYNEINDSEHQAISFKGNNHTIAYNEIYDCCKVTDDMGCIYSGRSVTARGTKIIFNYFHDIGTDSRVMGVYLDDGFCGGIIVGNVFENIVGNGVHLTGRDAIVKNNIFVNISQQIVFLDYRDASETSSHGINLRKSLVDIPYQSDIWKEAYPEVYDIEEHLTADNFNENNEISNNICVNSPDIRLHNALPRTWGVAENNYFTKGDVGFYDMQNRNYTLKQDAKAFKLVEGFKPIPFTRIGTYSDRAEDRVKKAIALKINSNFAYCNGNLGAIDENSDVTPVIVNNLTFVPIRFIVEGLGAEVEWVDETKTTVITKGQDTISFVNGSDKVILNGKELIIGEKVFISEGRTYIPLRAISEALGYKVFWDDIGFISISNTDNLFDSIIDKEIIDYLSSNMLL